VLHSTPHLETHLLDIATRRPTLSPYTGDRAKKPRNISIDEHPPRTLTEEWSRNFRVMNTMFLPLLLVAALLYCATASSDFQQQCLTFKPHQLIPGASLHILSYVPANTTLTFPDNDASCNRKAQLVSVDICRMALSIKTSPHSNIIFEAWLPETWTGRFLATGNGGIDGCMYINI
jgi:hypothetical protein